MREEASVRSLGNFQKKYLSPKKPTTMLVRLPKEMKHDLVASMTPPGVSIEGYMLGVVGSLQFLDHDC
jgi:hypothetical protein